MAKSNFVNLVFVIDESGSMYSSQEDIIGGFNKTIDEQRAVEDGECVVSLYKFSDGVDKVFIGKSLDEIKPLTKGDNCHWSSFSSASIVVNADGTTSYKSETIYNDVDKTFTYDPHGCTAMNDGIGTAIDEIGKWLSDMPEEERPSKTVFVIMTDGYENVSKQYTLSQVREMIKHQTEKYNWTFVYMGMDISTKDTADSLGINTRSFSSKSSHDTFMNYKNISDSVSVYRCADVCCADAMFTSNLTTSLDEMTKTYESATGIKIS